MNSPERLVMRQRRSGGIGTVVLCIAAALNATAEDAVPTIVFAKGDPVPNAGIDPEGAPAGARFSGFGIPAINDAGEVAYVGKWKSPTGNGSGVFVNGGMWVRADFNTGLQDGLLWKAFKDPMITATGDILFAATLRGKTVTSDNDSVIVTTAVFANLHIVARDGEQAPDAPAGAKWKRFISLAIGSNGTRPMFVASLQTGTGGVDSGNDVGLWGMASDGTLHCVIREGDQMLGKTLQKFTVLTSVSGSAGVTRSFNTRAELAYRATFTDGGTALLKVNLPQ
jgi:hypothetical protein